jgi:hypothetical protein
MVQALRIRGLTAVGFSYAVIIRIRRNIKPGTEKNPQASWGGLAKKSGWPLDSIHLAAHAIFAASSTVDVYDGRFVPFCFCS